MARDLDAPGIARAALPLAILAALQSSPTHGYALIEILSEHRFPDLKGGTLYPILARLEQQGLLESRWNHDQAGPGRKMFTTTDLGRVFLDDALTAWQGMGQTLEDLSTREEGQA